MANIVVSGASKGIGKAVAEIFVQSGHNVALCSRQIADLESVQKELSELNSSSKIIVKTADVSKKAEIIEFADFVLKEFGNVDVLINNAGVFFPGKIIEELDGAYEEMMKTNVDSAYYLSRALQTSLIKSDKGHIFNICSVASIMAYPDGGSYTISKYALLGFSKSIREELKEFGVKVTSVIPGATLTNSWKGTDIAASRFMKVEDIAQMIFAAYSLSKNTVVEDIVMRPMLGDL